MTEQRNDSSACDCDADLAAYVLGALDQTETAAFEAHLAGCASCQQELSSLRPVIAAMSSTELPGPTPRRLRRRVMKVVRASGRPARRYRIAAVSAAALMAAAALAFTAIKLADTERRTHTYAAQVTGTGSAEIRITGNQAELLVRDLPSPGPGSVYQVWLKRPGESPVATGALFDVSPAGDRSVGLPDGLRRGDQVMVTSEPHGGAKAPTSDPVIDIRLDG